MNLQDGILQQSEILDFQLRALYAKHGYQAYRMSKFEEYDLYANNKDFLVSDNVITFTDTSGRLMALKPDVTLSIIKNSADLPQETRKVYYSENVYRAAKGGNGFREIMQSGIECFGSVGEADVCEVIEMAAESLKQLANDCVLDLSNMSVIEAVLSGIELTADAKSALYKAIGEKNLHDIKEICPEAFDNLSRLLSVGGTLSESLTVLKTMENIPEAFIRILEKLADSAVADVLRLDFSVVDDVNYYNGIVFKGFISGIPETVISGGQYDRLMRKLHRRSAAIGFAVYMDVLERTETKDDWLNVALPKGRLGEKVYAMFAAAGFECPSILENNRKLIFENPEKRVRYFWVKPSDVAIYVERGAADIGVAGKDILLEYTPDVYELFDLKTGICRMAVAAKEEFEDDPSKTLRVATKFSNIARSYYQSKGREIDIIHLNGSIELAPILGLSDVIVDIVETGTTLRENHLQVKETIVPISARLIANKAAYKFKSEPIRTIVQGLSDGGKA